MLSGGFRVVMVLNKSISTRWDPSYHGWPTYTPPPNVLPGPRNRGLIAGLIKGKPMVNKAAKTASTSAGGYVNKGVGSPVII